MRDIKKLVRDFNSFHDRLNDSLTELTYTEAREVQGVAKEFAPRDTGQLRDNIVVTLHVGNKPECLIISRTPPGAKAPYNVYQEFGVPARPGNKGFRGKRFMTRAFEFARRTYPERVLAGVDSTIRRVFHSR